MPSIGQSQNERRAIVTITIGDTFKRMGYITHPLMRAYANRVGATFHVIDRPQIAETRGLAKYERFQLFELFDHFDRVAYVDTDVLIAPDAPSVFDCVPPERLGVTSEERYSQAQRDKRVTQTILGTVDWVNPYFNSGMMVTSRAHRAVFDPAAEGLTRWATGSFRAGHTNLLNDQPFLNHRVNKLGLRVFDLGYRFNHTRVIRETQKRFDSHFIHYAGPSGHRYGSRLEQMRRDAAVLQSPMRLALSRRVKAYRWFADRCDLSFVMYLLMKARPNAGSSQRQQASNRTGAHRGLTQQGKGIFQNVDGTDATQ